MSIRTFIFCDMCNPHGIRNEERRSSLRRNSEGRRKHDDCSWIEAREVEDITTDHGWIVTTKNKHVCPKCYLRHKEAVFSI